MTILSFAGPDLRTKIKAVGEVETYQKQISALQPDQDDQETNKEKTPNSDELEEDEKNSVSTLTFNFIYYLIYKFKPADVL